MCDTHAQKGVKTDTDYNQTRTKLKLKPQKLIQKKPLVKSIETAQNINH